MLTASNILSLLGNPVVEPSWYAWSGFKDLNSVYISFVGSIPNIWLWNVRLMIWNRLMLSRLLDVRGSSVGSKENNHSNSTGESNGVLDVLAHILAMVHESSSSLSNTSEC